MRWSMMATLLLEFPQVVVCGENRLGSGWWQCSFSFCTVALLLDGVCGHSYSLCRDIRPTCKVPSKRPTPISEPFPTKAIRDPLRKVHFKRPNYRRQN